MENKIIRPHMVSFTFVGVWRVRNGLPPQTGDTVYQIVHIPVTLCFRCSSWRTAFCTCFWGTGARQGTPTI